MSMNRHEPYEELISASLAGDLTADERRRLDAHLDGCAECRSTLAAFADQRRVMAGLRHVAPPRDLNARVRTGIASGALATLPWWRRPAAIFAGVGGGLAVVTGALLAMVLLNPPSDDPQVGDATPTASAPTASSTPAPGSPAPSPAPIDSGPPASAAPTPSATPELAPEPDVFLALTGPYDNLALTIRHGPTGETMYEVDTPMGPPIAAELSPDGQWLAYITRVGLSGNNEVRATHLGDGETVVLGQSVAGSPFLERLAWSPDGLYLAYTVAEPEGGETDVWLFEPESSEYWQLTATGDAYAGSWVVDDATPMLWISQAGDEPVSHLNQLRDDTGGYLEEIDPAGRAIDTAEGIFQPLLNPNGTLAIYWRGRMAPSGDEWLFIEGGAPHLAEHNADGTGYDFDHERDLFSDLVIGRSAFSSAAISWGLDGDAYAVWDAQWTGTSQAPEGLYPDPARVYFGHATDIRGLTRVHAIDEGNLAGYARVVDVKVAPTGRHLIVTAEMSAGGDLDAPRADLFLIERNTGDVPDRVFPFNTVDEFWWGPAASDHQWETVVQP
ncbi:MAG TPA: zf-HC2 domain-containing protein [Methylomirabilota bacterium]|nr:zf-HC2 domain-containing protein [Methylomirabilota bacterium]